MDSKTLLIGPAAALLLGLSGSGIAAAPYNSDDTSTVRERPRMMQDEDAERRGMMPHQGRGRMMGDGMMEYGMPGNCPMMDALAQGANAKVMMQMHGEMMRAMGDILIKYADKLETPSASK